jgi:hypothetical protein
LKIEETSEPAQVEGLDTKELGPAQARLLHAPVSSITEHTTRTFERTPASEQGDGELLPEKPRRA